MLRDRIFILVAFCFGTLAFASSPAVGQDFGAPDSVYFGATTTRVVDCSPTFECSVPVMAYTDAVPAPSLLLISFAWQGSAYCDTIVFINSMGADSVAIGITIDNVAKTAEAVFYCGPPDYQFQFGWPRELREICQVKFRGGLGDSLVTNSVAGRIQMHSWTEVWIPLYTACVLGISFPDTAILSPGDVDCSGIVTISDAVFLINYIFSAGNAPYDSNAADPDASCLVTISDAVYLINYIFAGGPAPQAGCVAP